MEHEMDTANDLRQSGSEAGDTKSEFSALRSVIGVLTPLEAEARRRILQAAATFLKIEPARVRAVHVGQGSTEPEFGTSHPAFSRDTSMSPKEFLLEKQPRTDVERIACLAYYLTHYRDLPHFKTLDLSKLNTEAAQPKFSNAANSVNNAAKQGYLVPSTKGQKQLSAAGEQFVRALPDRNAAKEAMNKMRPSRRSKRNRSVRKKREGQAFY